MRQWIVAAALLGSAAWGETPTPLPPITPALDLREQVIELPVKATNLYGREFSGTIQVTTFRPAGDGPFPLAVVNHGRAIAERRAGQGRQRFEPLARYLVAKGFAVFVPTRLGYGSTYGGDTDPEDGGSCASPQPEPMALAAAEQALAAVAHARSLPWVDASRWVAIGQSVGGSATVALAWRRPEGLVAAINFSGGSGGNNETRPNDPCAPHVIERLWGSRASSAAVPMLWLYWRNDLYWGPEWPARWARAWQQGGGRAEFHHLPPAGTDGHSGLGIDMDRWAPIVEDFLVRQGFDKPGLPPRPAPSGFATIDDVESVPTGRGGKDLYRSRFLSITGARAFAIGPGGYVGWASGDWAVGKALGNCQRGRGIVCKLYAVDGDVVWTP